MEKNFGRLILAIKLSEKQIQAGWQVVKFGEIAKEVRATTKTPIEDGLEFYVGLEHLDPQSLRIQRRGVIAEDNPTFNKRFAPRHILFGRRRAYLKKAAVADFEGICSGDITVIDAIPGLIIPKLLPFIVQSDVFFDWAVKNSAGGLSPRVKWKSMAEFEFPLPSVERQGEILEVLEKVEEVQSKINDSIIALEQLKYIYGYYRSQNANTKNISLKSIGEFKNGVNKSKEDFGKGQPFVNLDDVFSSTFIEIPPNGLVNVSEGEIENYSLKKTDILFVRSSVKPSGVGLTALIKKNLDRTVYAGFLIRLRLKDSFDSEYLNYSFHEPFFRHRLMAYVTVSANSNINQGGLEQLHVYYPDQHEIDQVKAFYKGVYQALIILHEKQRNVNQLFRKITSNLIFMQEVQNEL